MKLIRILFLSILLIFTVTTPVFSRDIKDDEVITAENAPSIYRVGNADLDILLPNYIFSNSNTKIAVQFKDPQNPKLSDNGRVLSFIVNGEDVPVTFDDKGLGYINHTFNSDEKLTIYFEDFKSVSAIHVISIWYVLGPIILLVILLGYKLFKGKKKKRIDSTISPLRSEKSKTETSKKEEIQLHIKDVVEEEEEVFS